MKRKRPPRHRRKKKRNTKRKQKGGAFSLRNIKLPSLKNINKWPSGVPDIRRDLGIPVPISVRRHILFPAGRTAFKVLNKPLARSIAIGAAGSAVGAVVGKAVNDAIKD